MRLTKLYRDIGPDLSLIEKELENAVATTHPELHKASLHLLKAGGKRIRPVFVLISGQFGYASREDVRKAAVALELIHMASLVHDDVIDDADFRRGRATIKSKWDNRIAMYTGDFMFSRSLGIIAEIDNPALHKILSDAMVEMSFGEMEQIHDLYNWNQNLRHYLRRIKRKTALLMAVSCQLGSAASKADKDVVKRLYLFGYYTGMSFQMTDDILDFIGEEDQLGKPAGSDLKQGNITLPVLYALQDDQRRPDIISFLQSSPNSGEQWRYALDLVIGSDGIERSKRLSAHYMQKAYQTLEALPNVYAKHALIEVANYMTRRQS